MIPLPECLYDGGDLEPVSFDEDWLIDYLYGHPEAASMAGKCMEEGCLSHETTA